MAVPPYRRRRINKRFGVGPLDVFRACENTIGQTQWPEVQQPQRWIEHQPAFYALLEEDGRGGDVVSAAANLQASGVTGVAKSLAELVFEKVRLEVAPDAPSRLSAVWAFLDPLDAFSFTRRTATAHVIFPARVEPEVAWQIVDMNAFLLGDVDGSGQGFEEFVGRQREQARHYWLIDRDDAFPEVIVGGVLRLTGAAIELVPWFVEQGLVVDDGMPSK